MKFCKLISLIREHLNNEKSWEKYRKDENYRVLCAALDVAGDINEAIHAYLHLKEKSGRGINYIYIYGIINSLQSQTNAVQCIYKFFMGVNLDINGNKHLKTVRLLRNKILAHPAEIGKESSGFGIVAAEMSTFSFHPHNFSALEIFPSEQDNLSLYEKVERLTKNEFNGRRFSIDIKELISNHQSALCHYLNEVREKLDLPRVEITK